MKEKREKRLEKEFRKLIYEIITTKLKNYDITEMFSISSVTVTSDLEESNIYISIFSTNKEKAEKTFNAIKDSAGEIRKILSREMRIRTVPKLNFYLDNSQEYGAKIDKIISGFTYSNQGEDNDENSWNC